MQSLATDHSSCAALHTIKTTTTTTQPQHNQHHHRQTMTAMWTITTPMEAFYLSQAKSCTDEPAMKMNNIMDNKAKSRSSKRQRTSYSIPTDEEEDLFFSSSSSSSYAVSFMNHPRKRVRFNAVPQQARASLVKGSSSSKSQLQQQQPDHAASTSSSNWYNKKDFKQFLAASAVLARTCNSKEYLDKLAHTYSSCCREDGKDENHSSDLSDHGAQHLAISSVNFPRGENTDEDHDEEVCTRGLERLSSPHVVGTETVRRRKKLIRSVLLAQYTLKTSNLLSMKDQSVLLRNLSSELSKPAKKFASALGTVDAISALMEYGRESRNARAIIEQNSMLGGHLF